MTTGSGQKSCTAAQLRQRRETLHISRRELAELAKVPIFRVWQSENPEVREEVSDEDIYKICVALDRQLGKLVKLRPLRKA